MHQPDTHGCGSTEIVHKSGRLMVQHRTDRAGDTSIIATVTIPAADQLSAERMAAAVAHELHTAHPAILADLSAAVRDRLRRQRSIRRRG
ncbi:hypothetical protein P7L78_19225 [Tistrella bauzanensis]|uniref:hypothetical protein n=1 Tax=Tistrella TaxID=171436 RepID=UPI0031F6FFC1